MECYFSVLRKYAVFAGRALRKEFWMFVLISAVVVPVRGFINGPLMRGDTPALPALYTLAVVLPGFAVAARRLHDTDRSGWWLLILLVPIVGTIVLLVFMATPGGEMANRFGASPKKGSFWECPGADWVVHLSRDGHALRKPRATASWRCSPSPTGTTRRSPSPRRRALGPDSSCCCSTCSTGSTRGRPIWRSGTSCGATPPTR